MQEGSIFLKKKKQKTFDHLDGSAQSLEPCIPIPN